MSNVDRVPNLRSWGLVAFLMSTMVLSVVDRFGLSVMIEPIKTDLHVTDREIGLLNGIAFGAISRAPQDPGALRAAIAEVVVPSLAGAAVLFWQLYRSYDNHTAFPLGQT